MNRYGCVIVIAVVVFVIFVVAMMIPNIYVYTVYHNDEPMGGGTIICYKKDAWKMAYNDWNGNFDFSDGYRIEVKKKE